MLAAVATPEKILPVDVRATAPTAANEKRFKLNISNLLRFICKIPKVDAGNTYYLILIPY